jgi:hypothetical protein
MVAGCETECVVVTTFTLGGGAELVALRGRTVAGVPHSFLRYRHDGVVRAVTRPGQLPFDLIESLDCDPIPHSVGSGAVVARCVAVFSAGTHSSGGALLTVDTDGRVRLLDTVEATAPGGRAADLDGDGLLDLVLAQSTYQPDFATAPIFWQTWLRRADEFVPTGCTEPRIPAGPVPSSAVRGYCPSTI